MRVREGVTVLEGVAEAVTEGVRVAVEVDVEVGVIEGVNVCEAVAVGVNVDVVVTVGSGLPANEVSAVSAVPSPPVCGIRTSASESSGCDDLHRRFGKLKPHMAITRSVAPIK